MELKKSQFDQTDPFAAPKQLVQQARQWQEQIKRVQQLIPPEALADAMRGGISQPINGGVARYEPSVHFSTVEVPAWDSEASSSVATATYRPRRVARHIPWQWRLIVAGIRLTRMMRRSARQQMKQFNKVQRQIIRRVLPRQKPMRGARAR